MHLKGGCGNEKCRFGHHRRRPCRAGGSRGGTQKRRAGHPDSERDSELGGILNQCIHNGFRAAYFKEELTGPEYAARFIAQVQELGIEYKLNTMVLDLAADKTVTAMNKSDGLFQLHPKAVILAMGCRGGPRGALNIPGSARRASLPQARRSGSSTWKGISPGGGS